MNVSGSLPVGVCVSAKGPILCTWSGAQGCSECVGDVHGVGVGVHSDENSKDMAMR